jgi:hypothetical protein
MLSPPVFLVGVSFEVFRHSVRLPGCFHLACRLPCSSAPLQSLTATVSHPWSIRYQPMSTRLIFAGVRIRPSTTGIRHEDGHRCSRRDPPRGRTDSRTRWHSQATPSWGSGPFGGISTGDRSTVLPRLYRPLSGFLTLSAVFSHPSLVALFHATSAHRISVFRAFPSPPAVISLDIRCSPVVFRQPSGYPANRSPR